MKVYLDDIRQTPIGWVRTYTSTETIELLKSGKVTELSLDHDLGLYNETGYTVLLWIEEQVFLNRFKPPKMYVHSANPSAAEKMRMAIKKIENIHEK